ncbi:MAG: MBL fold metallo-hydrolase [Acidobacteriota bacterium]|nr:MBL fold metallo-hydrolase [Acidobacteriota bacterium]
MNDLKKVRLTCLGSGDAFSSGGRRMSGYLLETPESALLLDCGPTVLQALRSLNLPAAPVDMIFLSHLHGDHFGGLPFLFLHYLYIEPRTRPLSIAGSPGTESRVRALYSLSYTDTAAAPSPYELNFVDALPGSEIAVKDIRIVPFPVPHQAAPPSLGCEIFAAGRKIVYSGDSGWTDGLPQHTKDADLFLCECTFFDSRSDTHLDYPRIAENRERFGAKRILLTHLGQEMLDRQNEVEMEMASDGLVIEL